MKGNIHSIETLGLLDGPGIRVVIFFQGCPLRCSFCHNPDSWSTNINQEMTTEEILNKVLKYKPYFKETGGVTFSGGEPLLQGKFLVECLKLLKNKGIHTCIDTCGVGNNLEEVLKYTDLVIYDIKALNDNKYKELVKHDIDESIDFLELCQKLNKKIWIRQVIIPGYNDNEDYINNLSTYIKSINNVKKVELLPYHSKAIVKYQELNIPYQLVNVPEMDKIKCKELEELLIEKIKSQ